MCTSFLTNIYGDNAIICDNELYQIIKEVDNRLTGKHSKSRRVISYPDNVVSAALLGKIAKRATFAIPASEMTHIKSAGGVGIFGGGYLLSSKAAAEKAAAEKAAAEKAAAEKAAAEKAAAEKAAAEKAAAEKAAAEKVRLTPQELRLIDELDGHVLPFYEQKLF